MFYLVTDDMQSPEPRLCTVLGTYQTTTGIALHHIRCEPPIAVPRRFAGKSTSVLIAIFSDKDSLADVGTIPVIVEILHTAHELKSVMDVTLFLKQGTGELYSTYDDAIRHAPMED